MFPLQHRVRFSFTPSRIWRAEELSLKYARTEFPYSMSICHTYIDVFFDGNEAVHPS